MYAHIEVLANLLHPVLEFLKRQALLLDNFQDIGSEGHPYRVITGILPLSHACPPETAPGFLAGMGRRSSSAPRTTGAAEEARPEQAEQDKVLGNYRTARTESAVEVQGRVETGA